MKDKTKIVGEFEKNSFEVVRVSLGEFSGHNYVHIRTWIKGEDQTQAGVLLPTKKGIALRVELLPRLKKLIDEALAEAKLTMNSELFEEPEELKGPGLSE